MSASSQPVLLYGIPFSQPVRAVMWLLLHKRDEHAIDGWDPEDHPRSVLSGRTNEQVSARSVTSTDIVGDAWTAAATGRRRR